MMFRKSLGMSWVQHKASKLQQLVSVASHLQRSLYVEQNSQFAISAAHDEHKYKTFLKNRVLTV